MKLKYGVLVLAVLNALVLAWQLKVFSWWGVEPTTHREPTRVQQQIRPEVLHATPEGAMRSGVGRAPDAAGASPIQPPLAPFVR